MELIIQSSIVAKLIRLVPRAEFSLGPGQCIVSLIEIFKEIQVKIITRVAAMVVCRRAMSSSEKHSIKQWLFKEAF